MQNTFIPKPSNVFTRVKIVIFTNILISSNKILTFAYGFMSCVKSPFIYWEKDKQPLKELFCFRYLGSSRSCFVNYASPCGGEVFSYGSFWGFQFCCIETRVMVGNSWEFLIGISHSCGKLTFGNCKFFMIWAR